MEDYKKRMQEEYSQLVERVIKLDNMLTKHFNKELDFELSCPIGLLERQLIIMNKYMHVLEERALIEGIDLSFNTKGE